ncbi:DUF2812 domain-containing protein [Virgibacillus chiguensis]|uniref:DUF2812 domain-containing protein n=1 Tax=Virgibacillus chiguensis TaxID=411959 RepID=A0A1M5WWG5_9BACI|nr:DUF2812 domain-containing protein [Virgibacillus chiguensis]SHH91293.1 Protein of unknown function [Virgibacillus chiguensis]
MKTVWKPFWSYDVKKTEKWLQAKALQGERLVEIKPLYRLFLFEASNQPQAIHYHIAYHKQQNHKLPLLLQQSGWGECCQRGRWYIFTNQQKTKDIHNYPVRREIIKRNRNIFYFFTALTMYVLLTLLLFVIMSGIIVFHHGNTLTFSPVFVWHTLLVISIGLAIIGIFSTIRLYQSNKHFW